MQRPFKNLPPTGKAIPPPKISDTYQSKASLAAQAAGAKPPLTTAPNTVNNPISTNGAPPQSAAQTHTTASNQLPVAPGSPPLPPPPEPVASSPNDLESNYAVTEL